MKKYILFVWLDDLTIINNSRKIFCESKATWMPDQVWHDEVFILNLIQDLAERIASD
ncbi:MAG: hypothetical protein R2883_03390 [Caldisericia bacterium]